MIIAISFVAALCGCKCRRTVPPLTPKLEGDSIELVRVEQLDGHTLVSGKPSHFLVRLDYSLESRDTAILTLTMDQFPSPDSCVLSGDEEHAAMPVEIAVTGHLAISRGTHELEIPVVWPGDIGAQTTGKAFRKGAISFHASLSSDLPHYKFMTHWFGTQFCQRF